MFRSAIASFADKARRRPLWLERNGDKYITVQGYSPLDNLIYGAIAAAVIIAPIIMFLVNHP